MFNSFMFKIFLKFLSICDSCLNVCPGFMCRRFPQAYVELQIQKDANFFLFFSFCFLVAQNDKLEKGLAQPLLTSTEHAQDDDGDQECDASEEASEDSRRPANSLKAAYRLLTPSVKVIRQILMDFFLLSCYETCLFLKFFFSGNLPAIYICLAMP